MIHVSFHKQTLLNYVNDKYEIQLGNNKSLYYKNHNTSAKA